MPDTVPGISRPVGHVILIALGGDFYIRTIFWASLVAQTIKNLPAMQEIWVNPRSPGEGNGNARQYSCLEDPMNRGAWWATVHGVAKGQTQLSD